MTSDEDDKIQLQDKMNRISYNTTAHISNALNGIREFLLYVESENGMYFILIAGNIRNETAFLLDSIKIGATGLHFIF